LIAETKSLAVSVISRDYLPEGVRKFVWLVQMSSESSHFDSDNAKLRRYEALLSMADVIVHHGSLPELFTGLTKYLHSAAILKLAIFCLHDPAKSVMHLHICEGESGLARTEATVESSPVGWVAGSPAPSPTPASSDGRPSLARRSP